jgi:hypothetical protein
MKRGRVMNFKQRICGELINAAQIYKSVFMDHDYLIYNDDFNNEPYYIINATEGNFVHLTGVNPLLSAYDFYKACLNAILQETDFNFADVYKSENSVKGSVKRKLKSFLNLSNLFSSDLKAEENFTKGHVHCSIGTTDNQITVGFIKSGNVKPKTLLKGNCLNTVNAVDITLVLRRKKGSVKFDTVLQGEVDDLLNFISKYIHL